MLVLWLGRELLFVCEAQGAQRAGIQDCSACAEPLTRPGLGTQGDA